MKNTYYIVVYTCRPPQKLSYVTPSWKQITKTLQNTQRSISKRPNLPFSNIHHIRSSPYTCFSLFTLYIAKTDLLSSVKHNFPYWNVCVCLSQYTVFLLYLVLGLRMFSKKIATFFRQNLWSIQRSEWVIFSKDNFLISIQNFSYNQWNLCNEHFESWMSHSLGETGVKTPKG